MTRIGLVPRSDPKVGFGKTGNNEIINTSYVSEITVLMGKIFLFLTKNMESF
jgi:hypothetical protein